MVLRFYVRQHPKAQSAVVLILKRPRRRGHGLKSHPTDYNSYKMSKKEVRQFSLTIRFIAKRCQNLLLQVLDIWYIDLSNLCITFNSLYLCECYIALKNLAVESWLGKRIRLLYKHRFRATCF